MSFLSQAAPTIVIGLSLAAIVILAAIRVAVPGAGLRDPRELVLDTWRARRKERGRARPRDRRAVWAAGSVIVLALLVLTAVEGARWARALDQLRRGADIIAQAGTAASHPSEITPNKAASVSKLRDGGISTLRPGRDLLATDPVAWLARRLPWASDQVGAVDDLTASAVAAADVVTDELKVALAYNSAARDKGPPGPRLLRIIADSTPVIAHADARLVGVLPNLARDRQRSLLPPIASRVQQAVDRLQPVEQQAALAVAAGKYVPSALGAEGPRTYLVLYANPAELWPSGGFVGAVGPVTFTAGTPSTIDIHPQDDFNKLRPGQHVAVPYPLARYFAYTPKDSLQIGDAGWDPDFPSTAKLSESIYTAATAGTVDGTISIDPYVVSALLSVTGPVEVTGYGNFDSQNFFSRVDFIVNVQKGPTAGKKALPVIATAILRRVLSAPAADWPRMVTIFRDQAQGRHIQINLHDARLQKAVTDAHYGGAIETPVDDYLMVVDGNVGATKGDFYVKKSAQMRVEVTQSGVSKHQLVIHYDLPPPVDDTDRALNPGDGSYHDYVRIYLPESATLASFGFTVDGNPGAGGLDTVSTDHGKQIIAAFFRLPRGHAAELKLEYQVGVRGDSGYGLLLQKQAGIPGFPFSVQVSYPNGGLVSQQLDLKNDAMLAVHW